MFSLIISMPRKILSCKERMIFVCTYLQSYHFVSVKDMQNYKKILNHVETEQNDGGGQNTRNLGIPMAVCPNFMAFDWSTSMQVQSPHDLKNADINQLVDIMAGELRGGIKKF